MNAIRQSALISTSASEIPFFRFENDRLVISFLSLKRKYFRKDEILAKTGFYCFSFYHARWRKTAPPLYLIPANQGGEFYLFSFTFRRVLFSNSELAIDTRRKNFIIRRCISISENKN